MKIGMVLTASTGGIGRHVASVAPRLIDRGHRLRIFCPPVTDRVQGFSAAGLEVWSLARLDRAAGADLLHAHGVKAGAAALGSAWLRRTPLVVTWHNALVADGYAGAVGRLLLGTVARGADLTLGASSDLVADARRLGARRAQLAPVAAPVLPPPAVPAAEVRRHLGLAPTDIVVLTVARLAPQKNLRMVLDVAAAVRERPDLQFLVVGEGPLRDELTGQVAAQRSRVRLLGARADVASLLRASDVMLLTSAWEARALVAQEALLAGLPLISTRVGGIPELVGEAAMLIESGDVTGAVRELLRLADHPPLRATLAAAGRQRAASWPDEDEVAEDLLTAYATVLARRRQGRGKRVAGRG